MAALTSANDTSRYELQQDNLSDLNRYFQVVLPKKAPVITV